eukprot:13948024-Heterocapsa_arctica.AAC.1
MLRKNPLRAPGCFAANDMMSPRALNFRCAKSRNCAGSTRFDLPFDLHWIILSSSLSVAGSVELEELLVVLELS